MQKTNEGLKGVLIEREGPTGLIVTTTATRLHPENETRLLSITVSDTQAQTRGVMGALAAEAMDDEIATAIDYDRWHALQVWLAGQPRHVIVP